MAVNIDQLDVHTEAPVAPPARDAQTANPQGIAPALKFQDEMQRFREREMRLRAD